MSIGLDDLSIFSNFYSTWFKKKSVYDLKYQVEVCSLEIPLLR